MLLGKKYNLRKSNLFFIIKCLFFLFSTVFSLIFNEENKNYLFIAIFITCAFECGCQKVVQKTLCMLHRHPITWWHSKTSENTFTSFTLYWPILETLNFTRYHFLPQAMLIIIPLLFLSTCSSTYIINHWLLWLSNFIRNMMDKSVEILSVILKVYSIYIC